MVSLSSTPSGHVGIGRLGEGPARCRSQAYSPSRRSACARPVSAGYVPDWSLAVVGSQATSRSADVGPGGPARRNHGLHPVFLFTDNGRRSVLETRLTAAVTVHMTTESDLVHPDSIAIGRLVTTLISAR